MDLEKFLQHMVRTQASDLFLLCNSPASVKINGEVSPFSDEILSPQFLEKLAFSMMDKDQNEQFKSRPEMNLALSCSGLGRFRVNIFRQRNSIGLVIRAIKSDIPTPAELNLPASLNQLIMQKRGLLLVVGPTGSGKSSTVASLLEHRNQHSSGHIITIEDPIEYIYRNKKSLITQREIGIDTCSYSDALINALRQAPDLISIGEIRSQETMEYALQFADTGHLCLSTLHAHSANQALDRVINMFSKDKGPQIRSNLSMNLKGIISQRLIPSGHRGRIAAVEILINTPFVSELILQNDLDGIKEIMEKSENLGMQTLDMALYNLAQAGKISTENALNHADSVNNLRLKFKLEKNQNNEGLLNDSLTLLDLNDRNKA